MMETTAAAEAAFDYPIPWWAGLAVLWVLGVLLHLGIHTLLQSVAARRASEAAAILVDATRDGMTMLERLYRLPWQWLATSWLTALWVSTVIGGFAGLELLGSFYTGAGVCAVGSLSSWAGAPVMAAIQALLARLGGGK